VRDINPDEKCEGCPHRHVAGEGLTHWYVCDLEECDREESAREGNPNECTDTVYITWR